jgi:hypothetical protein
MGIRSKVVMLPATVRAEVDRLIVERAFSGCQALAQDLQAKGYRISDDSLQRYGVRLRHQLDALNLARYRAQVLAAGKNSGDTPTAIMARQIQQHVLSILPQAADSQESYRPYHTGSQDPGNHRNPAYFGQTGEERGRNTAAILASGEMNTLGLHDLVRLSDMRADLNRIMSALRERGLPLSDRAFQVAADQLTSQPDTKKLCEKVHDAIATALLAGNGLATQVAAAAQRVVTALEQIDAVADVATPVKTALSPAQTHHSPVETQLSPAGTTQPQLTAPHRTSQTRRLLPPG